MDLQADLAALVAETGAPITTPLDVERQLAILCAELDITPTGDPVIDLAAVRRAWETAPVAAQMPTGDVPVHDPGTPGGAS